MGAARERREGEQGWGPGWGRTMLAGVKSCSSDFQSKTVVVSLNYILWPKTTIKSKANSNFSNASSNCRSWVNPTALLIFLTFHRGDIWWQSTSRGDPKGKRKPGDITKATEVWKQAGSSDRSHLICVFGYFRSFLLPTGAPGFLHPSPLTLGNFSANCPNPVALRISLIPGSKCKRTSSQQYKQRRIWNKRIWNNSSRDLFQSESGSKDSYWPYTR